MDDQDPGRELMLRLQQGSEEAFTEIVRRYEIMVVNFAYRYLGDLPRAEDIAQEAFLRVYRARHRWKPAGGFRVWLLTITTRLCLNEIRASARHNRRVRLLSDEERSMEGFPEQHAGNDPREAAIRSERAELVRQAVGRLSDNQRLAVLLHRFEGLSYGEVARTMGVSVEAVRSLLVRARRNLKQYLKPLLGADSVSEGVH